ncbi:MAG: hypothetical protein ABEJ60_03290 [Halodesulfurarchaeum sp.]
MSDDRDPERDERDGEESEQASIPLSELRSAMDGDRDRDHDRGESDAAESMPLSELRDTLTRSESDDGDEAESESAAGPFVEEQPEPVDTESVWADLLMDDGEAEGEFEPTEVESTPAGETQVISKHICERCRYLAEPPELRCTHAGTAIHELVDVDHVRVTDCPMVGPEGESRRLE